MTQLEVHVVDFKHQAGVTNETSIYAAVADAFNSALQKAESNVLEPIMRIEVSSPEDFVGISSPT